MATLIRSFSRGEVGRLDHALSSASLTPQVAGAAVWAINMEEPRYLDYNDEILDVGENEFSSAGDPNPSALFVSDEFRSSDHNPVIVGLNLTVPDPVVPNDCSVYMDTLTPTHVGDDGPNTIYGTQGDDIIFGMGGNDRIFGRGGNDIICGGDGNDRVDGGSGDDHVYGGNDVDRVYGRSGDDFLFGNDGNDYMAAANGNDHMFGGAGNDRMFGQNGDDVMEGGTGDDTLNGGRQTDTVDGGTPDPGVTETNRCIDTEVEVNCGTVTGPPAPA